MGGEISWILKISCILIGKWLRKSGRDGVERSRDESSITRESWKWVYIYIWIKCTDGERVIYSILTRPLLIHPTWLSWDIYWNKRELEMLGGCEFESHHKSIRADISWKRTRVTYIRISVCLHWIELVTVVLMLIPTRRNTNVFTVDLHWRWNSNVLVNVLSSLKCRGWCTHIVRPFCRFFVLFIPFLFIGSPFPFKIWVFKEMIPFCYPRFLPPRFLLFLGHLVP